MKWRCVLRRWWILVCISFSKVYRKRSTVGCAAVCLVFPGYDELRHRQHPQSDRPQMDQPRGALVPCPEERCQPHHGYSLLNDVIGLHTRRDGAPCVHSLPYDPKHGLEADQLLPRPARAIAAGHLPTQPLRQVQRDLVPTLSHGPPPAAEGLSALTEHVPRSKASASNGTLGGDKQGGEQ
jgi:hypothetical protein